MDGPGPAKRQPPLVLVSLALFLLLLPLTLAKPGLPPLLKADEAAYYLAALSLWHDGDLECDDLDIRRLFREFYGTDNLLLMGRGAGQPVYFSVPITYPLAATPFVALFGANGMVLLNAVLLVAMIWMGSSQLRRYNKESLSMLFAAGYFLLSTAFVYMFWLQTEIFNMACVMGAFFLVERAVDGASTGAERKRFGEKLAVPLAAGSATLLALAIFSRPMLVVLALPLLFRLAAARSWRGVAVFAVSGVLTSGAVVGASYGLTGETWPYFAPRAGISVSSPVDYVERRAAPRLAPRAPAAPVGQISKESERLLVTMTSIVRESTSEFLVGRHGGFLVYMPFAALSILYFLLTRRRSAYGWILLASAALTAVLFVTIVRGQWLGGGGFVGNRYFTAVYPAFLFLVRDLRPAWLTAIGYAAAAIFLGPLLITPLGAMVPYPTLQAHVRNQPFPRLPLEWSLVQNLAGYRYVPQGSVTVHGRRDEIQGHRGELWIQGAKRVDVDLLSNRPTRDFIIDVRNIAPDNVIELCLEKDCDALSFTETPAEGDTRRVTLGPVDGHRVPRAGPRQADYRYPLSVVSTWGEQPRWRGSGKQQFYLGAALVVLGEQGELDRDLYSVEWLDVGIPESIVAGAQLSIPLAIRNSSPHVWPSAGATRVRIGYRWQRTDDQTAVRGGKRQELPGDVAPGERIETALLVEAPKVPGVYDLALDLVRERVNWFSRVDGRTAYRRKVEITPLEADPKPGRESPEPEPR